VNLKESTQDTLEEGSDTEDEAEAETEMKTETANQKAKRMAQERSQQMMNNKRTSSNILITQAIADGSVVYR
jgi:hypothetical protein